MQLLGVYSHSEPKITHMIEVAIWMDILQENIESFGDTPKVSCMWKTVKNYYIIVL